MTRNLDPDRRRPGPTHPGYEDAVLDIDVEFRMCRWCHAAIPDREGDKLDHVDWDDRIARRFVQLIERVALLEAGLATVAFTSQLSGSGSNAGSTEPDSPDPDPTSGAGRRVAPPASDPNVPTPEQEVTAGRSGVEGANGSQADAGTPPSDVTETPDPASPRRGRSGVANRSRSGGPGDASTGRLPLPELGNPARFAR